MPDPQAVRDTGDDRIDGLLTGYRWDENTLSYSFPGSGVPYVAEAILDEFGLAELAEFLLLGPRWSGLDTIAIATVALTGFEAFSESQRDAARYALGQFDAVSGLEFAERDETLTDHALLRYGQTGFPFLDPFGVPPLPITAPARISEGVLGDVWLPNDTPETAPLGSRANWLIMHETGHILGLKHGHETGLFGERIPEWLETGFTTVIGPPLPAASDNFEFTVMTYESAANEDENGYETDLVFDGTYDTEAAGGYPQSLMQLDIQAIQHMYGADFGTNAGDTVYSWSPDNGQMFVNGDGQGVPERNRVFRTIWDGDGQDTYDLADYDNGVSVDLRPGAWTTLDQGQLVDLDGRQGDRQVQENPSRQTGLARGNVANALLFNDDLRSLIENARGGRGDDRIIGNIAANTLDGGLGDDWLEGADGGDTLIGAAGSDTLYGGAERDSLAGGLGSDFLLGEDGADELQDGDGMDTLSGGNGNDTLDSGFDRDTLDGGAGHDLLNGGDANDSLGGGTGNDSLNGGAGADALRGGAGNDSLTGGSGSDRAVFQGAFAEYEVDSLGGNRMRIRDTVSGRDGTDLLAGVETARFVDGDRSLTDDTDPPEDGEDPDPPEDPPPEDPGDEPGGGGQGGQPEAVDWDAIAARVSRAFEETGQWFDPENPVVFEEPVDWDAVAARVTRNFEETGQWFY